MPLVHFCASDETMLANNNRHAPGGRNVQCDRLWAHNLCFQRGAKEPAYVDFFRIS
jgi:hypothetical protein